MDAIHEIPAHTADAAAAVTATPKIRETTMLATSFQTSEQGIQACKIQRNTRRNELRSNCVVFSLWDWTVGELKTDFLTRKEIVAHSAAPIKIVATRQISEDAIFERRGFNPIWERYEDKASSISFIMSVLVFSVGSCNYII